ncbi:hypothetical protein [Mangrovicoccus ximenensis]|uniref:hypothetical protein n=1 Tax=Mangrovicoccus ximenensis TaxID=1911570 RepID=UPI00191C0BA0|nr:hypothetical protein [Mangrovicoccus ximenensis]
MNAHSPASAPIEHLLGDFAPDFDFVPAGPIPVEEYAERMRKLKREAVSAGHDAIVVHCDSVGWFHAAHAYLRYLCDWMREGVLVIPMDEDKEPVLLSFFTRSVILPPGGDPVGINRILQIGAVGREYADIPGDSGAKTIEATVKLLGEIGAGRGSIGFIGDKRSAAFRGALAEAMPGPSSPTSTASSTGCSATGPRPRSPASAPPRS